MAADGSSADVLNEIWEKFADRAEASDFARPTKRSTSRMYLEEDPSQLGKWTNPGKRTNWRIPLAKVLPVCTLLGAGQSATDNLMLARLNELQNDDPKHDAVVAAVWACDFTTRRLTADDEQVLQAFRDASRDFPLGLTGTSEERRFLQEMFRQVVSRAQAVHMNEHAALQANDSPEAQARIRAYQQRVTQKRQAERDEKRRNKSMEQLRLDGARKRVPKR